MNRNIDFLFYFVFSAFMTVETGHKGDAISDG